MQHPARRTLAYAPVRICVFSADVKDSDVAGPHSSSNVYHWSLFVVLHTSFPSRLRLLPRRDEAILSLTILHWYGMCFAGDVSSHCPWVPCITVDPKF